MTKGLENGWRVGEASSDFDVRRAFAHGEYMGALREQERIIKLLEEHADLRNAYYHEDYCRICSQFNGFGAAIALIKGEINE